MNRSILISLSFIIFSTTSCSTSKELREERKDWDYANWEIKFKDRALCLCILEGFNKQLSDSIKKNDKSFYDPLSIAIFDSALDPLIREQVEKMKLDSVLSIGRFPQDLKNSLEGKRVLNNCTNFYKSEKLNNAAKNEKLQWKKIKNIKNEINKVIPTY